MDQLEEQGIELLPSDPNDEEEEEEDDWEEEVEEEEEEEEDEWEEEEEEEWDEEENEEQQDGDIVDGADMDGRSGATSSQVLYDNHVSDINSDMGQEVMNVDDLPSENANDVTAEVECECSSERMDIDDSKGGATASLKGDNDEENGELNRGEIDGLFCPICFEAWSSGGDHHVCCLPCGHIYGLSCIQKWLRRQGSSKCPQCKMKCQIKDIRAVRSLEAKCASLEKKEVEWKKREADLLEQIIYLKEAKHQVSKRKLVSNTYSCKYEQLMQEMVISQEQLDALKMQLKDEAAQEIRAEVQPAMAAMQHRMAAMEARVDEMVQMVHQGVFPPMTPSILPSADPPLAGVADPANANADLGG